jgi:FixJ family two-component response regulator
LAVADNGRGIATDRLSRIFEPFYTTRPEGLGMGLAISRSIVDAHGGVIDAGNNETGGATFRVVLSLEDVACAPTVDAQDSQSGERPAAREGSASVAIVDDDAASRDGVARLLASAGWRVVAFGSAAAALESDTLRAAHCMLLDVQMPGMSGLELHGELIRQGVHVPTIFVTARNDAATGVDAIKRGAVEYLTKPVDERILLAAVSQAVARHAERAREAREREGVVRRIAQLTPRERDVMRLVIAGSLNKQIAADLSISQATVKQHRGQVMSKMRVRSVAELVRLCEAAGFGPRG